MILLAYRIPYIAIAHFPCFFPVCMWSLVRLQLGPWLAVYFYWPVLLERPVPALCWRPQSGTRGEFSSQRMAAGCDSPDKGHDTLRWVSAAGTQALGIPQAGLLHRELGAQIWGLTQVTDLLCFLVCKMEIIFPASWSYLRGYISE